MSGNADVNWLSRWMDESLNSDDQRSIEEMLMHRTQKIAEEYGEVVEAIIGFTGTNPRKGVTHSLRDIDYELLDVALAALGSWAHTHDNCGQPVDALIAHAAAIRARAEAL